MGLVVRYFSTSSAGAADGTTWADRAALFSAGNWSSVITGFSFAGSDSLRCRIGPGTYTCSQALASGLFANPPSTSAGNLLFLEAAEDGGTLWSPPTPAWSAARPMWSVTGMPVIDTSTNIATVNLAGCALRGIHFNASGRTSGGVVDGYGSMSWCQITNSAGNTSAVGVNTTNAAAMTNCVVRMTGSAFRAAVRFTSSQLANNVRLEGNASASSGNRRGLELNPGEASTGCFRVLANGFVGGGIVSTSTNAGNSIKVVRSVLANNGGSGIVGNSTASQTRVGEIVRSMITGNGAYGVDASSSRLLVKLCRLRDNTSGNFNGLGQFPTDWGNETASGSDAAEYVDASNADITQRDFRIKSTSSYWGLDFGIEDQAASTAGGFIIGG